MEKVNNISGYRWVVLGVLALISALIQIQWLTFAPIAREAKMFYDVSAFQIDFLSMIFMVVFIVVCIPASYVIDTYGLKVGIGIGAILTGIFSLLKGIFAADYTMVLIFQTGLAVAQPFLLNATTKVAGVWFPIEERATAVGIATLAQFLGIIIVMICTPLMVSVDSNGIYQISNMLMIYGVITIIGAIITLIFLKDKPQVPVDNNKEEPFKVFEGLKHMLSLRDMRLTLLLFFIGLGAFNAISTCIDQICQIKGLTTDQTGLIGGMMLIAGIVGAIILPVLSDKFRKRKIFITLGMILSLPGIIGLTFFTDYSLLLVSSFIFGFFLLGAGAPVGFQYCAEITYPAPESTSQGVILLAGQISGILFIIGMNIIGMIPSMMIFIGLVIVNVIISFLIKESEMIQES